MFWIILSVILWGLFHSLLASLKAKELVLRWFGESLARYYRLAYNLFAVVSFMPILLIAAVSPDRRLYVVPLPWSAIMGVGQFLTVVMLVVAFRQTDVWEFIGLRQILSRASNGKSGGSEGGQRGHLVTSGVYRYIRHPLYSAGLVFIWLLSLMTVNILAINLSLTVYIVVGAYFEERKLRREYGQDYGDYADITPMFVPFLKGNKTPR